MRSSEDKDNHAQADSSKSRGCYRPSQKGEGRNASRGSSREGGRDIKEKGEKSALEQELPGKVN